jgi:hypothetical protein
MGVRTHDLPACSVVPLPTALPDGTGGATFQLQIGTKCFIPLINAKPDIGAQPGSHSWYCFPRVKAVVKLNNSCVLCRG